MKIQVARKNFNNQGKWVEKVTRTQILTCKCGNKYLKTRSNQTMCVKCMYPGSK